jgi:hypothetical protein
MKGMRVEPDSHGNEGKWEEGFSAQPPTILIGRA